MMKGSSMQEVRTLRSDQVNLLKMRDFVSPNDLKNRL